MAESNFHTRKKSMEQSWIQIAKRKFFQNGDGPKMISFITQFEKFTKKMFFNPEISNNSKTLFRFQNHFPNNSTVDFRQSLL